MAWIQARCKIKSVRRFIGNLCMSIVLYMCRYHNWSMELSEDDDDEYDEE
ncbi:MAG: hypothetical protein J6T96_05430 [Bacteroidales bacterium]|nr:hypothetical protein [Bacteroidales bacterium]